MAPSKEGRIFDIRNPLMSEVRFQMSDVRSQMSDVRCQMSDVRSQMSDVRCQMSDVRCLFSTNYELSIVRCIIPNFEFDFK